MDLIRPIWEFVPPGNYAPRPAALWFSLNLVFSAEMTLSNLDSDPAGRQGWEPAAQLLLSPRGNLCPSKALLGRRQLQPSQHQNVLSSSLTL